MIEGTPLLRTYRVRSGMVSTPNGKQDNFGLSFLMLTWRFCENVPRCDYLALLCTRPLPLRRRWPSEYVLNPSTHEGYRIRLGYEAERWNCQL